MKLRASHGLVGNDVLGIRFGYLNTIKQMEQVISLVKITEEHLGMEKALFEIKFDMGKQGKQIFKLDLGLFQDHVFHLPD